MANKIIFVNKTTEKELLSISLDGATLEEIESTKGLLSYENNINENEISISVEKTVIKPFTTAGKMIEVEVNNKPLNSDVIVCGNPSDNNKTALLEAYNGDVLTVQWHEITKTKQVLAV